MSKQDKPLPQPPKTPFGSRKQGEGAHDRLIADELALAAASGNLDEYMKKNIPDNEHARRLAMMMMGMTGMIPDIPSGDAGQGSAVPSGQMEEQRVNEAGGAQVPEDIQQAVMAGDIGKLKDLLIREHQKRSGADVEIPVVGETSSASASSGIEKDVLDQLIAIASDNSVTLDWLIMRALKVYIQDFQKTGRL